MHAIDTQPVGEARGTWAVGREPWAKKLMSGVVRTVGR